MIKLFNAAIAAIALAAVPMSAGASAPCKVAKGKFTKCPPAATAAAAKPAATAKPAKGAKAAKPKASTKGKCRDAKGRFAKCGTPGTKPA
jgi:hypothetical protein